MNNLIICLLFSFTFRRSHVKTINTSRIRAMEAKLNTKAMEVTEIKKKGLGTVGQLGQRCRPATGKKHGEDELVEKGGLFPIFCLRLRATCSRIYLNRFFFHHLQILPFVFLSPFPKLVRTFHLLLSFNFFFFFFWVWDFLVMCRFLFLPPQKAERAFFFLADDKTKRTASPFLTSSPLQLPVENRLCGVLYIISLVLLDSIRELWPARRLTTLSL